MPKAKHLKHGEHTQKVTLSLTESAVKGLDQQADALKVSRSHLVDMIGRGEIALLNPEERLLGEYSSN